LCNDPVEEPVQSDCGHIFCKSCIIDYLDTVAGPGSKLIEIDNEIVDDESKSIKAKVKKNKKNKKNNEPSAACPTCGEELTIDMNTEISFNQPSINPSFKSTPSSLSSSSSLCTSLGLWNNKIKKRKSIIDRIDLKEFQTSTKLEALMEELYKMQQKDLGAKAIVFSQFVNMLDIIEYRLLRDGIDCSKLQGSMSVDEREITIKSFKENVDIKVLLISLKAGGVALNLTVASHIFIMDPW
jgi:DNA repair protein RAD16